MTAAVDIVLATFLEIADLDEDVVLACETVDRDGTTMFRVALRAPAFGGGTVPLFDSHTGELALEGYGTAPAAALVALRQRLESLPAAPADTPA